MLSIKKLLSVTWSTSITRYVATITLGTLLLTLFSGIALERLMAGDEGFYALATRLVFEGKTPYISFFYPQMPLLPYMLNLPTWLSGYPPNWIYLRIVAAIFATLTCLTVFAYLNRICARNQEESKQQEILAAAICLLLATNPIFFAWQLTVESYAFTTYFLLAAVVLREHAPFNKSNKHLYCAGALFAAACATRLYVGALFPLLILGLSFRQISAFLLGASIVAGPCAILLLADPQLFWFNNLDYHLNRSGMNLAAALSNKHQIAMVLLGLAETRKFCGISTAVLTWGGLAAALIQRRQHPLIARTTLALIVISFLPTPAYVQYFSLVMPFLALLLGTLALRLSSSAPRIILSIALILTMLLGFSQNLQQYTKTGRGVLGVHGEAEDAINYSLRTTINVAKVLNEYFDQQDVVFSNWSGYLVEAQAQPLLGTENRFGLRIAQKLKLTKTQLRRLRLTTMRHIRLQIAKGAVDGIILRDYYAQKHRNLLSFIESKHFEQIYRADGVTIWKKKQAKY